MDLIPQPPPINPQCILLVRIRDLFTAVAHLEWRKGVSARHAGMSDPVPDAAATVCEGAMLSLNAGQTGGSVSPVYVPDLRPTADAAALRRQAEPVQPVSGPPAAAFPPVAPPSAVAQGEVGRSLLAAVSMSGGNVDGGDERRLKPWGVAMLPHVQPEPVSEPESEPPPAARKTTTEAGTGAAPDRVAPVGPSAASPVALAATAPEQAGASAVPETVGPPEEDAKGSAPDDRES